MIPEEVIKLNEMADFVERTILRVNCYQESNAMETTRQFPDAVLKTIEERVKFAKEAFSWTPIREEILNSIENSFQS